MNDLTSTKIKFLQEAGTESMPHKNQSLFEHLVGVRDKLKNMGAPDHVQDAGLFHSIYGTDSYKNQTTNDRRKVKDLIGERVVSGLQNARKKGRIGGRPTNLTSELEEKIIELRERKLGLNKISAECKVSVPTIRKVLNKVA